MSVRISVGLATDDAGVDSFAEAAARATLGLAGAPCDLALVFAAPPSLAEAEDGLALVEERIRPEVMIGCGAQGVVAGGSEHEEGGVVVWAASLPGSEIEAFHLEVLPAGDDAAIVGMPEVDGADAAIMLADPYTFPAEAALAELPGLPIIGGLSSAPPGEPSLLLGGEAISEGAIGVLLRGVDVRTCVSQGARPIGPEMSVTAGEGNTIEELASEPALERLKRAIGELEPAERTLAARGLLLGIVIDPNKPDYGRGDFLIRGITGVDEENGSLTVASRVRVGQTVQLQVRDAASAHDDLVEVLDKELAGLARPPAGALVFTCNGRGAGMFGTPDHDARAVDEAVARAPSGGFFCAGEIGPVGQRSFVHGFTATLALFS